MRSRLHLYTERHVFQLGWLLALGSLVVTSVGSIWPLEAVGALPLVAWGVALILNIRGLVERGAVSEKRRLFSFLTARPWLIRVQGIESLSLGLVSFGSAIGHGLGFAGSSPFLL